MGTREMLAAVGMTPDQVRRAARRHSTRRPDDGKFETGDDLVEAINENRPGYMTDLAASHDAMYHGSLMRD